MADKVPKFHLPKIVILAEKNRTRGNSHFSKFRQDCSEPFLRAHSNVLSPVREIGVRSVQIGEFPWEVDGDLSDLCHFSEIMLGPVWPSS